MSILTKKDREFLNSNKSLFEHSVDIMQKFRTRTEMEVSVLNDVDNPTSDAKYWQLQREVTVMYQETKRAEFEERRSNLKIKKLKLEQAALKVSTIKGCEFNTKFDEIAYFEKQVDVEEAEYGLTNLAKQTAARVRELRNWKQIQERLKPKLEFSDTDPDEHQMISYTRRFIMEAMALPQSKASAAEAKHILAHLYTSVRYARERGLLNKIIEPFTGNPGILQLVSNVSKQNNKPDLKVVSNKKVSQ